MGVHARRPASIYCWLVVALSFSSVHSAFAREEYYSDLKACPVACSSTEDPSQWTLYDSLQRLTFCHEPMLFEVSLSGAAPTRHAKTRVRACTTTDADDKERIIVNAIIPPVDDFVGELLKRDVDCPAPTKNSTSLELVSYGDREPADAAKNTLRGLAELQSWVQDKREGCEQGTSALFSYVNGTVLGYLGGDRVAGSSTSDFFETARSHVSEAGVGKRLVLQHCAPGGQNGTSITGGVTLGVVADTHGGFVGVQRILREWHQGRCVEDSGGSSRTIEHVAVQLYPSVQHPGSLNSNEISFGQSNSSAAAIVERQGGPAECRWIRAEYLDDCGTLATKCRITGDQYMSVNPQDGHCATLRPGQPVCCSRGRLPELRPRQNPDGSCFAYTVKTGDTCSGLAAFWGLQETDLFDLNNNKTWAWTGCNPLGLGVKLCLSPGSPPFPDPVDNAVCGPTKPGSRPNGLPPQSHNYCPLNACCSVWGHCGTTAEFCTEHVSPTLSPGTPDANGNGCISNCGTEITGNWERGPKFYKLGYFEGWNPSRDCLHMDVRAVQNHRQQYTDIHFAFAHISPGDFDVVIPDDVRGEFDKFVRIRGVRRVLAFGGWTFSAEEPNFRLFRQATQPGARERFARNCLEFAMEHDLDGLDFDWEYPSAPDLPAHEPGAEDEAQNYLEFLKLVRRDLPAGMTLSIAAPASFWYLKQFPIREMAPLLDYIVYMTYDLHGQWDAGNPWSMTGCPGGNCLRSHTNWTLQHDALVMITKAGVPAWKVLLGVATYGRSFKMERAGCDGPQCTFLGDRVTSFAKEGRCTKTGGYLANAEIFEQIDKGVVTRQWSDATTRSNYLVYEGIEWVSYLDNTNRAWRESRANQLNFGGTIEWAVDLQEFFDDDGGMKNERDHLWTAPPRCRDSSPHDTLEALENDAGIPPFCLPLYALEVIRKLAHDTLVKYDDLIERGYDKNFDTFRRVAATSTQKEVQEWVLDNAATYMNCRGHEYRPCCSSCPQCWNCVSSSSDVRCEIGSSTEVIRYFDAVCPPERVINALTSGNLTFTFKSDEAEDEFYKKISSEFGVDRSLMMRATHTYKTYLRGSPHVDCSPGERDCVRGQYLQLPLAINYFWGHVPDPKELLEGGIQKAGDMPATLYGYEWGIRTGLLQDDPSIIVDAFTLPVLMMEASMSNMQKVFDMGVEIRETQHRDYILLIVEVVLFIVPFLGKLAGSLGAVAFWIRTTAGLIGDLGLIGIDIWKITEAETEDEKAILGLGIAMTGAGSLLNIPSIREAGKLRKQVRMTTIGKITSDPNARRSRDMMAKSQNVCHRYA